MPSRRAGNKTIIGFKGLDLRRLPEALPPESLVEALNVDLTTGGGIKTRAQLKPFATVDASSVGLYAVGNALRVAVPYRTSSAVLPPPNGIQYDFFADSTTVVPTAGANYRVSAVAHWTGVPYLCISRDATIGSPAKGRIYTHHYFDQTPVTTGGTATNGSTTVTLNTALTGVVANSTVWFQGRAEAYRCTVSGTTMTLDTAYQGPTTSQAIMVIHTPLTTRVALPFEPNQATITASQKIYAGERYTGDTWYCSSINGPRDWTNEGDAGFIPTSQYSGGSQRIQAYGQFNGRLIVMYETTVQKWIIDPDPAYIELDGAVGGAGTTVPGSVANMMGDLIYFAQGGFRSLKSVVTTGQLNDGDVGAPIMPETRVLDLSAVPLPVALWSPSRAQYLCGIGTTMYAFTNSPVSNVMGWTKYSLSGSIEAMAELEGVLYIRFIGDNVIYKLDENYTYEPGFTWKARFAFYDGEDHTVPKYWRIFDFATTAPCSLRYFCDPNNLSAVTDSVAIDPSNIPSRSYPQQICNHLAAEFSGSAPCNIDRFTYRFDTGNL